MPRNNSGEPTIVRQWRMLQRIPRYPEKITTEEITSRLEADGFPVTIRTVQRDLIALSRIFPLVSEEKNRPFGWSWQKNARAFDIPCARHLHGLVAHDGLGLTS